MGMTLRERAEHDRAVADVEPYGPAEVNGMPRHVYVPDTGPREDGQTCQFIFEDGGTARCRSTFIMHARLGWVHKQGGSR
jgi:hypothetical protein